MADTPSYSFTCSLATDRNTYSPGDPVLLSFKLTNNENRKVYVLKWHTPLEGFRNKFLEVFRRGEEVHYRGMKAKRGNPTADSYILVLANDSVSAQVNMCEAYDVSVVGEYEVRFRGVLMDVTEAGDGAVVPHKLDSLNSVTISCNTVKFEVCV